MVDIPQCNNKLDIRVLFVLVSSYLLLGLANYMIKGNFNLVGPWLVIAYYWFIRLSRDPKTKENMWCWGNVLQFYY